MATDRPVALRPRANRPGRLTWFLNGLVTDAAGPLSLERGSYELRCVDAVGEAAAVRFVVR